MNLKLASSFHLLLAFASFSLTLLTEHIDSHPTLQPRETLQGTDAKIVITTYPKLGCAGTPTFHSEITYTDQNPVQDLFMSLTASRALTGSEQLDFSMPPASMQGSFAGKRGAPSMCGLWKSTVMQVNGCLNVPKGESSCLRLWHY